MFFQINLLGLILELGTDIEALFFVESAIVEPGLLERCMNRAFLSIEFFDLNLVEPTLFQASGNPLLLLCNSGV